MQDQTTGDKPRAKEIQAHNAQGYVVYRIINRDVYIRGSLKSQSESMITVLKQKGALKAATQSAGWVKLEFVDEVTEDGLHTEFFNSMVETLKKGGFIVTVKEL